MCKIDWKVPHRNLGVVLVGWTHLYIGLLALAQLAFAVAEDLHVRFALAAGAGHMQRSA
jgi:hypothetical protein